MRTLLPQQIDSAEEPLEIAVCLLVENCLCYWNRMACMTKTLHATRSRTTACQCCVAKPIFCENAKGSNAIATVSDLHLRVHCAAKIFTHPDNVPVGAAFLAARRSAVRAVSATQGQEPAPHCWKTSPATRKSHPPRRNPVRSQTETEDERGSIDVHRYRC